jgi:hypothetical protein
MEAEQDAVAERVGQGRSDVARDGGKAGASDQQVALAGLRARGRPGSGSHQSPPAISSQHDTSGRLQEDRLAVTWHATPQGCCQPNGRCRDSLDVRRPRRFCCCQRGRAQWSLAMSR